MVDNGDENEVVERFELARGDANNDAPRFNEKVWTLRLKNFSGRKEAKGEYDYDTWNSHVQALLEEDCADRIKKRLILHSLSQPAIGIVHSLGQDVEVEEILDVLKAHFGSVANAHSRMMKFYETVQEPEESASTYVQRLQTLYRRAVDAGAEFGIENPAVVVSQFCRGSHDELMISTLHLDDDDDGGFERYSELISAIKKEELRRVEKASRFSSKSKLKDKKAAVSSVQGSVTDELVSTMKEMLRTELASQVNQLASSMQPPTPASVPPTPQTGSGKIFNCYFCHEPNHIARDCPLKKSQRRQSANNQGRNRNQPSAPRRNDPSSSEAPEVEKFFCYNLTECVQF